MCRHFVLPPLSTTVLPLQAHQRRGTGLGSAFSRGTGPQHSNGPGSRLSNLVVKRKKGNTKKTESRLEAEGWLFCPDFGEHHSQVVLSCPAWAWQSSGTWMGTRCAQPWQLFMGVLAALKDEPHAWLCLGSRLGWPEGLDFLQLLLLWVLGFPCWAGGPAARAAIMVSAGGNWREKGELEGRCPPELTPSGTS